MLYKIARMPGSRKIIANALSLLCCATATAGLAQTSVKLHEAAPLVRITKTINAANLVTLKGNTHPLAQARYDTGAAPSDLLMDRMLLVLKPTGDQEAAMRELIDAQHTQGSDHFHKWISPDEFGAKFGAAPADIDAIRTWLQTQGFTVNAVAHNNRVIDFSGTASQVAKAFHTEIRNYTVNGESHYANAADPQIPASLAGVVAGVASLNNFHAKPSAHLVGHGTAKLQSGKAHPDYTYQDGNGNTQHVMVPDDFHTIYNETPILAKSAGDGITIAVIARTDVIESDFTDFQRNFLSAYKGGTLNVIHNGTDPGIVDGDLGESSLDMEWAEATAPNANIDLIVSASTHTTDGVELSQLYAVEANRYPVMTSSFGLCERTQGNARNQMDAAINAQAAAEGMTAIVSAGDNGSAGCDDQNASGDPDHPTLAQYGLQVSGTASTPYNIAVGGNQFQDSNPVPYWNANNGTDFSSALGYIPEGVWNESCAPGQCAPEDANLVAGSGGASSCTQSTVTQTANGPTIQCVGGYSKPSWQANGIAGMPNDNVRDLPDISLTAAVHDGYQVCINHSCVLNALNEFDVNGFGGTSAAAPSFAGIMAVVNQATGAKFGEGQANYVLYPLFKAQGSTPACVSGTVPVTGTNQCVFYDVVNGTNAVPCAGGSPNCSAIQQGTVGVLSGYSAGPGYDLATGLGSLNVTNLVNNWTSVKFNGSQTGITVSPASFVHGSPVNTSITVAPLAGSGPAPTGLVSLLTTSSTTTNRGIAEFPLTGGAASETFSGLPGGTYQVFAQYSGDATYGGSQSAPSGNLTVTPEPSNTGVTLTTADANGNIVPVTGPFPYSSPLFINVSVAGQSGQGTATGLVTVAFNGKAVGLPNALNTFGAVQVEDAAGPGSYVISAGYAGDASFNPSQSASVPLTLVKGPAQIRLAVHSGPPTVSAGGTIGLDAIILPPVDGVLQTGSITLMNGAAPIGQSMPVQTLTNVAGNPESAVQIQLTSAQLNNGVNSLTAVYSGDGNYNGSTSAVLTVTDAGGSAAPASLAVTATPPAATPAGTPATSTVNIAPAGGFTGAVNLSCTVTNPSGITPAAGDQPACSLPANVTVAANTTATATLTVTSVARPAATSSNSSGRPSMPGRLWWLAGGGGSGLACLLFLGVPSRKRRLVLGLSCFLPIGFVSVGCGGGNSSSNPAPAPAPVPTPANPGTPAGAYVVTVNAVSATTATVQASTTVTVNIQ